MPLVLRAAWSIPGVIIFNKMAVGWCEGLLYLLDPEKYLLLMMGARSIIDPQGAWYLWLVFTYFFEVAAVALLLVGAPRPWCTRFTIVCGGTLASSHTKGALPPMGLRPP